MQYNYDIIIIGSGPGGEGAAMKATRNGKKVAIIEGDALGGGCTHWGTIPSKTLRQIAREIGMNGQKGNYDFPKMLEGAYQIADLQTEIKKNRFISHEIDIYYGFASFKDNHTIRISRKNGSTEIITAENFILATGSRPYHPSDIDFSHPRILDSDKILTLQDKNIKSISIYGAGVIGCEYASILRALDIHINLINTRDKLMSFLDDEIVENLTNHFCINQHIHLINNETYKSIQANDDYVTITLQSGRIIESDYVLFALGRSGNIEGLNLDKIGVQINPSRGQITVDDSYQTSVPNIYAVGDVIGPPSLASAAFNQGRFAATHIIDGSCNDKLVEDIPTGIYTRPEISSIGKTEQELIAEGVPYEVGRSYFKELARAQISKNKTGMLKILFNPDSGAILGIHCFGHRASEIIHIGQAIKAMPAEHNTIRYFLNTTFNYPTMAEAYRIAAIDGVNKAKVKKIATEKAKTTKK
ncbi:NAD(P) transhydrogenase [Allofrancisella inopinata]|uniref:Soluble pyridine nucleotide transhydrogenase n=1 Tax=Allofrancisella inopinata TaxID=1085647 RepID=A0AAE6YHJ6_9GAMM|nr:Si-specific NAD(P)(+) transhydrogenase [Allofrancisella inopinata]QIV95983.1 Si-specific NAD(P)(+) transhydrogenase [Allofrancisella inopinata]TDT74405.1 NAD(P) transhydrogenase [Allofrancisella inopinata]